MGSIIYECGDCIILSIFRLVGDSDLCQSFEEVARNNPVPGQRERTYLQCVNMLGAGALRYVDHLELKTGSKYLIHADGKEDEPHCVSMCITHNDDVLVSDLNSTYFYSMSGIRDLLADSVDNPVIFEYIQDAAAPPNSSQTRSRNININLLSLASEYYLGGDTPILRCRDLVGIAFADASGEVAFLRISF